jgi:hypothetical protein
MSINKTVVLSPRQQLVDLNGDTTNFNITFTVTSKNNEQFDLLVVDQTTLDNNPKLEFKRANGTISGNIISDKNIYQNYFLCIKTDQQCEVDVVIDKKEIKAAPPQEITKSPNSTLAQPSRSILRSESATPEKPSTINWKMIGILVLLIVGGTILYQMYSKNKGEKSDNTVLHSVTSPKPSVTSPKPSVTSPKPSSSPVSSSPLNQNNSYKAYDTKINLGGNKANSSLISRLNNMPLK